MSDLIHITPKTILFLQALVVIGVPLLIWRFGAVPYGLARKSAGGDSSSSGGRFRWLAIHAFFPLAIVQIFAGVLLGPSVFGRMWPEGFNYLFRPELLFTINTIANIAIVLLVFIAGCETDRKTIQRSAGTLLKIGFSGVAVPWLVGILAAMLVIALYGTSLSEAVVGKSGNYTLYAIAFGLCMSVTALPILLILMRELNIMHRPIGSIALAIAGIDDMLLWLSIAIILPFAGGSSSVVMAFLVALAGGALMVGLLAFVISPYMQRLIDRAAPERFLVSCSILVLFISVLIADVSGLHAVVGAFVAGLLMPEKIRHLSNDKFDMPVNLLLMPFFFLATGLKTKFDVGDPTVWVIVAIGLTAAIAGKALGVSLPIYFLGRQSAPFATLLGILMQCKGLMEILVISVLLEKGVIGTLTFSALVLVALISNGITSPLSLWCIRKFGARAYEAQGDLAPPTTVEVHEEAAVAAQPTTAILRFGEEIGDVPISKTDVVIGRHSTDDVSVNDIRVSRKHARLKLTDAGEFELVNQTAVRSEPNPVLVNGTQVERAILKDGDVVSLGGVDFTFLAPRGGSAMLDDKMAAAAK